MIFFQKKDKAFTLIELLVVVAIIGILATIVMVNVNSARTKGKDKSIITSMNSLRAGGEMWANSNNGSYNNFCGNAANCSGVSTDWQKVCSSVKAQGGYLTCKNSASAWVASSSLVGGGTYCVDSINNGKIITSDPGAGYVCP